MAVDRRAERVINLLCALLESKSGLTRDEIFEQIPGYSKKSDSARRMFERDKDDLRIIGVDLQVTDESSRDGQARYFVDPNTYAMRDPLLLPEEAEQLAFAASLVKTPGFDDSKAIFKLGASATEASNVSHEISLETDTHLMSMLEAKSANRLAIFRYNEKDRTLAVSRLSLRGGHWYVSGIDTSVGDKRMFRLDRMQSGVTIGDSISKDTLALVEKQASKPWSPLWRIGESPAEKVVVSFSKELISVLTLEASFEKVVGSDDDRVSIEYEVSNFDSFFRHLVGYGIKARIESPPKRQKWFLDELDRRRDLIMSCRGSNENN